MIDSPSGGAPKKAPIWDLTGTEGCGGGKVVSWLSLMFLGYKSIYRRKKYVGGSTRGPRGWGARLPPWARPCLVGPLVLHRPQLQLHIFVFRKKKYKREGFIAFYDTEPLPPPVLHREARSGVRLGLQRGESSFYVITNQSPSPIP